MNSARRLFAAFAVALALCVVPAAQAKVDYSMNSTGGDYAPAVTPAADTAVPTATDSDFAWGAAALGAGAALAVVLLITVTRTRVTTTRSRRADA